MERLIRAYDPWPGTSAELGGKRLKIFPPVLLGRGSGKPGELLKVEEGEEEKVEIACGEGSLILSEVQLEGSRRMSATEVLRGHREAFKDGLK